MDKQQDILGRLDRKGMSKCHELHSNTGVLLAVTQSECTIVPSPCSTGNSFLFYYFLFLFCILRVYFRQWLLLNCHACPFAVVWIPAFLTSKAIFLVLQIFSSVVTFTFKLHNDFKRKTVYTYVCFKKKTSTFEPLLKLPQQGHFGWFS